jgi:hypothetical protein
MAGGDHIRMAQSCAPDARMAVREFHAAVSGSEIALVLFFCSSNYDLAIVADEIRKLFPDIAAIGCTTAGEIGPAGMRKHTFVGAVFPAQTFSAVVGSHDHLQDFAETDITDLVANMRLKLDREGGETRQRRRFALELIDGLSNREEAVIYAYQQSLGDIPIFGGSAGDDLKIEHTWVFCNGEFRTDRAVLAIIETDYPFTLFRTHHFVGGAERLVVTEVDTASRTVREINGLPAAHEYARILGVKPESLHSGYFAESPVVVRINGTDYVRSIRSANADGSLTFYCAIERGVILRVAHGVDFVGNLRRTFDDIHTRLGPPQLVIACDCIFRHLEISNESLTEPVESIYRDNKVIGFNTYGEQFMGIHINQTLTGIAIGDAQANPDV